MRQIDKAPETSSMPLYRQLQESFIADIKSGKLKPGDVVPSTYALTEQFGISRVTAVRCYEELKSLGFLTAKRGGSTKVNPGLHFATSNIDEVVLDLSAPDKPLILHLQRPPLTLVPFKSWMRTTQSVIDSVIDNECNLSSVAQLKASICRLLRLTRQIDCTPEQVLLFDTKTQAYNFIARCLIDKGDIAIAESSCDERLTSALCEAGSDMQLLSIDREGAAVDHLGWRVPGKLLALSPNAQLYSGAVMSERRRALAVKFAYETGSMLLEDDGLALLRFGKTPEPSMFHQYKNVLHLGCFGAYLAPLTELSYLVVTPEFAQSFAEQIAAATATEARLEHSVLNTFLQSGQFEQHIFRQKSLLTKARQEALEFVLSNLRDIVTVGNGCTGYELLLRFHSRFDKHDLGQLLLERGLSSRIFSSPESTRFELSLPLAAPTGVLSALKDALLTLKSDLETMDERNGSESFQPDQVESFAVGAMGNPVCA
ncbi:MAG: PLP-dependent aminotransferase family protein [Leptolyngbya sp.]|nr:PLP-dependent aminotransferase family protein [Candidatus Melainabacteria bacterium]